MKDKLGTRKVPTAELSLEGAPAELVLGTNDGVRNIVPMLHLTRTWNSITAASFMRRGLALARDYARKREAFGATLARQPLHADTLAGLQAEFEAAFHLSFALVELIGADEAGELDDAGHDLLRLLTSLAKLTTGRQAVAVQRDTGSLWRRGLCRRHWFADVAARQSGAADLGRHDQRAGARRAAGTCRRRGARGATG
ncbi:MAG TPA: acyl-CoA dehydrogenase family protein [Roseiflexaceae bacterium]|nr:acyl-CoA dehydrogenase family protein [Roseiflexaceae bacterium]